ncbi:hypothetical protein F3J44_19545 [Pantoea sp. Tr-811]|nr:hypothetical protein [Pantoea sp. Tr-811]
MYCTTLRLAEVPVGAGMPAKRPAQVLDICQKNYQICFTLNRFFPAKQLSIIDASVLSHRLSRPFP